MALDGDRDKGRDGLRRRQMKTKTENGTGTVTDTDSDRAICRQRQYRCAHEKDRVTLAKAYQGTQS